MLANLSVIVYGAATGGCATALVLARHCASAKVMVRQPALSEPTERLRTIANRQA